MRKFLAVLIAVLLTVSVCGCKNDENYPVTVGQIRLEKAPEKVVVLNVGIADVMLNLGYAGAVAGRSESCTQQAMSSVPSVGNSSSPDIDEIISMSADTVFADETLSEFCIERLREAGINVFRLDTPEVESEISDFYRTIGLIMGGRESGEKNAKQEYDKLYSDILEAAAQMLGAGPTYTICYLYLDENGNYAIPEKDSIADKMLRATGSSTVVSDGVTPAIQLLAEYNPSYIFYDSQSVLDKLGSSTETAELFAVKQGNCCQIPLERLELAGISASLNIAEIMEFMYPQSDAPAVEPTEGTQNEEGNQGTQNGTEPAGTDLSARYGITLSEGMEINAQSDPEIIKAMQQRLKDLGYTDSDPDGVFGSATQQFISDFQFLNDFVVDGVADYEFLRALFSSDAVERRD